MEFEGIHAGLSDLLALNTAESTVPHVVVALPSLSVGDSLLSLSMAKLWSPLVAN